MPFDRVVFEPLERSLKPEVQQGVLPPGWQLSYYSSERRFQDMACTITCTRLTCSEEDLVVDAYAGAVIRVRVNLARLERGGHGGVLRDQVDVDRSFKKLSSLLDAISSCPGPSFWKPKKLELGWNFFIPFHELEPLALSAKTNWVRKQRIHIRGREVRFKGSEFEVKIYNKGILLYDAGESSDPDKPVTRIEVTLSGKKLRGVIGSNGFIPEAFLSFARARWWLRECILSFPDPDPLLIPAKRPSDRALHLLLHFERQGYLVDGMSPIEFLLRDFSPRTQLNYRRRLSAIEVLRVGKSFSDLFPPDQWPAPAEFGDLLVPRPPSSEGVNFRIIFEAWRKIEDDEDDDEATAPVSA